MKADGLEEKDIPRQIKPQLEKSQTRAAKKNEIIISNKTIK